MKGREKAACEQRILWWLFQLCLAIFRQSQLAAGEPIGAQVETIRLLLHRSQITHHHERNHC